MAGRSQAISPRAGRLERNIFQRAGGLRGEEEGGVSRLE